MLGKIGSNLCLEAVLWVLQQKNYVTLSNNPYFYQDLPELPAKYDAEFNNKPLSFGKSVGDISLRDALYVLTDRAHHIYVKLEKGSRAFGNSWKPDKHIILKGRISIPAMAHILILLEMSLVNWRQQRQLVKLLVAKPSSYSLELLESRNKRLLSQTLI